MISITLHLVSVLLAFDGAALEAEPRAASAQGEAAVCSPTEAEAEPGPTVGDDPSASATGATVWCRLCELDGDPFYCCVCEHGDVEYCAGNS